MTDATGSRTDLAGGGSNSGTGSTTAALSVTGLASDQASLAGTVGNGMGNAWGIVSFEGMFWIANEATGKVSIVDGMGKPSTGKIASGALDLGEGITGIAVNDMASDSSMFQMHDGNSACMPAKLIFASTHGQLIGVNPDLSTTKGFVLVDRSKDQASYLGVAMLHTASGPMVLAADFFNARVDVFDASFHLVTSVSFKDKDIPAGFAPFNVMVVHDKVFVAFAKQSDDKMDEETGPGLGFVAMFDATGKLQGTIKSDLFNAPWGMAQACNFGPFPNALLVGNFGDGHVTAIDTTNMTVLGQLKDSAGAALEVDGLWGITFSDGVANARADGLYFAAGPDDEAHGLFGVIATASK